MKHPQTKFHAHTVRESQVIRSKKSQKLSLGQNFLAAQFSSLDQYLIETATTYSDMLCKL